MAQDSANSNVKMQKRRAMGSNLSGQFKKGGAVQKKAKGGKMSGKGKNC